MNQDEAERCIDLGISALKVGDKNKAIRFFQKSLNLHPTETAAKYLKIAEAQTPKIAAANPKVVPAAPKYSAEQEASCTQILRKTDYYDILGVSKTATAEEIKKSYRKLALKLHPDKNHAPSASEAFKKVNKSFACLSDTIKRKTYDQTGQEEVPRIEHNFRENDFAEHVFQQFFGEGFFFQPQNHQNAHRQPRTHTHRQQTQGPDNFFNRIPIIQLLPILLLILISIMSSIQPSNEVFSFHYTATYTEKRLTDNCRVEYYLTRSYAKDLTFSEKSKLEKRIEQAYLMYLSKDCDSQKKKKNGYLSKANLYKGATGKQYKDHADSVSLESCSKYQSLKIKLY